MSRSRHKKDAFRNLKAKRQETNQKTQKALRQKLKKANVSSAA